MSSHTASAAAVHPLATLLKAAAHGCFPPPDGTLAVLPAPTPYRAAVAAFTAHTLVAVDVEPDILRARLPAGDLGAPMSAPFLTWLGEQVGVAPGLVEVVLVHLGATAGDVPLIAGRHWKNHPRVARAHRMRQRVQVYTDRQKRGLVTLGQGLVNRWEMSVELSVADQNVGLGRALIAAARGLVPADEPVFAQVAPGNARSLRAFLAAGFRPIGAEVVFS